jgi:hypothetical protein
MATHEEQRSETRDPESMGALLGGTLALVQHGVDKAVEWGFGKLRGMPRHGSEEEIEQPALRGVLRFGRGVLRFVGGVGTAYYRRYEELKGKRKVRRAAS